MLNENYKPTILYVEDEDGIRNELSILLKRLSSELYLASNGLEGLEQYKKYNPDIVVSDIKMPKMSGLEMIEKIKELNEKQYIIFTTAFSDTDFLIRSIDLQVTSYVLKPVKLKKLENKINEIVDSIKLKDELNKKEKILIQQSKMASMGEMIGNIAHQWRQPLATISMSMNNLRVDQELGTLNEKAVLEYSEYVLKNTQYLSKTIDDFRDFFKTNDFTDVTSNLKESLEKCISLTSAAFKENQIKVIQELDENISIYGNSNQLVQAIINILNNAKDALKQKNQDSKCVFVVTAKIEDNKVFINIKDNAGGIPDNIIDRIFEPYFTTKHQSQGTGLGLYITYEIITKNLKGSIHVQNEEFEYEGEKHTGASFEIVLPVAKMDNLNK